MTLNKKKLTPIFLISIFFLMLGLSFAAVPLYELFFRVTGFAGTTQVAKNKEVPKIVINQVYKLRFDTNVGNQLEWDFFPEKNYASYNNNKKWKIAPGTLVDELSVYLALSQDVQNNPDLKEFTYQVALEDKVKFQTFFITGLESINLNDNLIETIIVSCPDLNLTLKLSKEHNFLPVYISKVNKKNNFIMVLSSFELTS